MTIKMNQFESRTLWTFTRHPRRKMKSWLTPAVPEIKIHNRRELPQRKGRGGCQVVVVFRCGVVLQSFLTSQEKAGCSHVFGLL